MESKKKCELSRRERESSPGKKNMEKVVDSLWCNDFERVLNGTKNLQRLIDSGCPEYKKNRLYASMWYGHAIVFFNISRFRKECDAKFTALCFQILEELARGNFAVQMALCRNPQFANVINSSLTTCAHDQDVCRHAVSLLTLFVLTLRNLNPV